MSESNPIDEQLNSIQQSTVSNIDSHEGSGHIVSSLLALTSRLSLMIKDSDRSLDKRFAQLRQMIDKGSSNKVLYPHVVDLNKRVEQTYQGSENSLIKLQSIIHQTSTKLQNINGLPPKLRQQLKAFMQQSTPYGYNQNLARLAVIIDYYHQALTNKPLNASASIQVSEPSVNNDTHHRILDDSNHRRISDELQCMISELDFDKKTNSQLAAIRLQLLDGIDPEEIPSLCQKIIQLMIDGFREERKQTQEYLLSLTQNLQQMDRNFEQSVEMSQDIQQHYNVQNKTLKRQILNLGVEIKSVEDLAYAKELLQKRVVQLGSLFKQNEQLEEQLSSLANQLQYLNAQLEQVRQQTAEQQQRMTSQKQQLFIDKLTQIYNRNALDERMELEYKRWKRYGYELGLAIIDIDNFKRINTQYGHLAGDKALKIIARALQSSLRDTDFLARFGGEEFVLLMPQINTDSLHLPLDHLREHIASLPFRFKGQQVSISISIGATLYRDNDQLIDAFERADQALFEIKTSHSDSTNIIL